MKMWSMKVIILLLFCYASLSTGNQRVYFVSRNFYNVLHWDLMKPAFPGEKILYSVKYWSDAMEDQTRIKEECQNITALSCDLTAETPSVHDVHYRAKVYCNSRFCGSTERFKPIAETVLGPPILSTKPTVSSLHVNATLPLGPNGVSVADIITSSKNGPSKSVVVYILKITHPTWAAQANEATSGRFIISLKNNQTEYCGYVMYKPSAEWGRADSEHAAFCVTLPDDPLSILPWLLGSAAILTAIITTLVVCMCNYVRGGKEKSMPQPLATMSRTPTRVLQFPDRNLIISMVDVCMKHGQTVYATILMKPNMPSFEPGGYSPQDTCEEWQSSTGFSFGTGEHSLTPNPEDTSAQSSEIYSVVVHEHNKDIQQAPNNNRETSNLPMSSSGESWDKAGTNPKLTSHGVQPLPHPDPCESNPARPLLLQTVRDTNGQLVLPSLISQLQNSTDDTVPALNPERKPLLSDLIDSKTERPFLKSFDSSDFSDSGCDDSTVTTPTQTYCNTHYFPSQPVAPYLHQGWENTPSSAIRLETASKDSYENRKTDYPRTWTGSNKQEKGEEDEDRGEEGTRPILLGGWVVHIQE